MSEGERVRLTTTVSTGDVIWVATALNRMFDSDPLQAVIAAIAAGNLIRSQVFGAISEPERLAELINEAAQNLAEAARTLLDAAEAAETAEAEEPRPQ